MFVSSGVRIIHPLTVLIFLYQLTDLFDYNKLIEDRYGHSKKCSSTVLSVDL